MTPKRNNPAEKAKTRNKEKVRLENLRESEERFRIMADIAPTPIWIKGPVWLANLCPADKEQFFSAYVTAFNMQKPFRVQARFRNLKGEYRWYDTVGTPRFSRSGKFLGYVGASIDVTESKRIELHARFINELDLELSEISGETESIRLLITRLGEYLGVGRCLVAEIDPNAGMVLVREDWQSPLRGARSMAGEYRIADFISGDFRYGQQKGQPTMISDVTADPRTRDFVDNYNQLDVMAVISVPIFSEGKWEAVLTATQPLPREWRPDEARLMHDVATRLWLAVKRARALDALRESEARARRTLAEQMVAGVAECDPSGKFMMVNQRYCDITGRTREELLTMRISDITHPDDWPHNAELYRRLFEAGESFFMEKRYRYKDGSIVWVNTHVSPVCSASGKVVESVSVVIDVTARKRTEQELAAAKDRLAADLEAMTRLQKISGTFVREGETPAFAGVVESAVAIARATKGDMVLFDTSSGKFSMAAHYGFERPLLDFWTGDQTDAFSAVLKRGQRVIVEDVALTSALNPIARDVLLKAGVRGLQVTPVLSRSGELLAALTTYYQTVRRTDERAFQPLYLLARQAAEVIERAQADANLRSAYEQAEAAIHAKDEFLAVISHELRSPLTSILGYARLLRDTEDKLRREHFVNVIERNGKAQLQLIEDLLDTARIASGKLKLEVQPLDLVGVIRDAIDVVRPAAQAKGIKLCRTLDPVAQITGDPDRLQQVVWNLLSNAIKFTPPGGRVDIVLERADPFVQIAVRDTGKGIDPEFLPHIFERFRQSDMSSRRRVGGLGLGLWLVKELVELHGGSIQAGSKGQGAVFTVRLPLRAVYTAPTDDWPATIGQATEQSLAGVHVLIVDDEQEVRTLLTLTLEGYGAKTQAVGSAKDAVALLFAQQPDEPFHILISDIGMPDEDGYALMEKVRGLPVSRGGTIPAIALTAYGNIEHRMRALEAGFQTYAVKPVEPNELVAAIQGLLKGFDKKVA